MTSANITTKIEQEVIIQETEMIDGLSELVRSYTRTVVDTQESQMRQALMSLGWTPPSDPGAHDWECILPGLYDSTYRCRKCTRKFTDQVDAGVSIHDCPFPCRPPTDEH